jgi:hypothetical protein
MSPKHRLPELARFAHRFTAGTRARLERSFVKALRGQRYGTAKSLQSAVGDATRELQAAGLVDQAVLDVLGAFVEDTGHACGANRPSLISGELPCVAVRAHVLRLATAVLHPPGPVPAES